MSELRTQHLNELASLRQQLQAEFSGQQQALEEKLQDRQRQLDAVRAELDQKKTDAETVIRGHVENNSKMAEELERTNQELQSANRDLQSRLDREVSRAVQAESKIAETERKNNELKETLSEREANYEKTLYEANAQFTTKTAELDTATARIKDLITELDEANRRNQEFDVGRSEAGEAFVALQAQNAELAEAKASLEHANASLEEKVLANQEKFREFNTKLQASDAATNRTLKKQEQELARIKGDLTTLLTTLASDQQTLANLGWTNGVPPPDMPPSQQIAEIRRLVEGDRKLHQEALDKLELERKRCETTVRNASQQSDEAATERADLHTELDESQGARRNLQQQYDRLANEISALNKKAHQDNLLLKQYEELSQQQVENLRRLSADNETLKDQVKDNQAMNTNAVNSKEENARQINALAAQLELSQVEEQDAKREAAASLQSLKVLRAENDNLRREKQEQIHDRDETREQLRIAQEQFNAYKLRVQAEREQANRSEPTPP